MNYDYATKVMGFKVVRENRGAWESCIISSGSPLCKTYEPNAWTEPRYPSKLMAFKDSYSAVRFMEQGGIKVNNYAIFEAYLINPVPVVRILRPSQFEIGAEFVDMGLVMDYWSGSPNPLLYGTGTILAPYGTVVCDAIMLRARSS